MNSDDQTTTHQFTCWFQRADYSIHEYGPISEAEAVAAFLQIDIDAEGEFLAKLDDEKKDWCSFGFGLNGSHKEIVHLYCTDSTQRLFEVVLQRPRKWFGLITTLPTKILKDQTVDQCEKIISTTYRDLALLFE